MTFPRGNQTIDRIKDSHQKTRIEGDKDKHQSGGITIANGHQTGGTDQEMERNKDRLTFQKEMGTKNSTTQKN